MSAAWSLFEDDGEQGPGLFPSVMFELHLPDEAFCAESSTPAATSRPCSSTRQGDPAPSMSTAAATTSPMPIRSTQSSPPPPSSGPLTLYHHRQSSSLLPLAAEVPASGAETSFCPPTTGISDPGGGASLATHLPMGPCVDEYPDFAQNSSPGTTDFSSKVGADMNVVIASVALQNLNFWEFGRRDAA